MILADNRTLQAFDASVQPTKGFDEQYFATVEVFHYLHCLDLHECSSGETTNSTLVLFKIHQRLCGNMLVSWIDPHENGISDQDVNMGRSLYRSATTGAHVHQ